MADYQTQPGSTEAQGNGNALPSFLSPDITLMILTYVTFFLLLAILYKYAWKPILTALDAREEKIRKSLEEAQKTHEELAKIDETREKLLLEAEKNAKDLIAHSKKAASDAAKIIQDKAREESQILLENANREIKQEQEKAQAMIREESARIATDLAGKIIEKNLDKATNRKLINQFIKDL